MFLYICGVINLKLNEMRLVGIQKKNTAKVLKIDGRELYAVVLTFKNWLGNYVQKDAYPTNYGVTGRSESVLYYFYTDENGKEFSEEISKRINNWHISQSLI